MANFDLDLKNPVSNLNDKNSAQSREDRTELGTKRLPELGNTVGMANALLIKELNELRPKYVMLSDKFNLSMMEFEESRIANMEAGEQFNAQQNLDNGLTHINNLLDETIEAVDADLKRAMENTPLGGIDNPDTNPDQIYSINYTQKSHQAMFNRTVAEVQSTYVDIHPKDERANLRRLADTVGLANERAYQTLGGLQKNIAAKSERYDMVLGNISNKIVPMIENQDVQSTMNQRIDNFAARFELEFSRLNDTFESTIEKAKENGNGINGKYNTGTNTSEISKIDTRTNYLVEQFKQTSKSIHQEFVGIKQDIAATLDK